jgi:transcriptional regulator with XRE-family HTH domain
MVRLTRLREIRERVPMTQAELAEAAGLSARAISMIERGESEPHPRTIRAIAEALSCQSGDLWNDPEKSDVPPL